MGDLLCLQTEQYIPLCGDLGGDQGASNTGCGSCLGTLRAQSVLYWAISHPA